MCDIHSIPRRVRRIKRSSCENLPGIIGSGLESITLEWQAGIGTYDKSERCLTLPYDKANSLTIKDVSISDTELAGVKRLVIHQDECDLITMGGAKVTIDLGEVNWASVVCDDGTALLVSGKKIQFAMAEIALADQFAASVADTSRKRPDASTTAYIAGRKELLFQQVKDLHDKAALAVIDFCLAHGVSDMWVGNPGKKKDVCCRNNRWSVHISRLMALSLEAGIKFSCGDESNTTRTCPICGTVKKGNVGRTLSCSSPSCDFKGHRDIVGALNMFPIGFNTRVDYPHTIERK